MNTTNMNLIVPIKYSSETLLKIDEMLQSDDVESRKLALSMCLQEFPEQILNYCSPWLQENFKIGLVRDVINEGINCINEYELSKYCWAIHFTLDSFTTICTN